MFETIGLAEIMGHKIRKGYRIAANAGSSGVLN
jgi:hypothetical protein